MPITSMCPYYILDDAFVVFHFDKTPHCRNVSHAGPVPLSTNPSFPCPEAGGAGRGMDKKKRKAKQRDGQIPIAAPTSPTGNWPIKVIRSAPPVQPSLHFRLPAGWLPTSSHGASANLVRLPKPRPVPF